ncbi:MAG: fibronectin type III domain-containing protein [Blautia sp.]|nr:fibronectin type III domain-containing protein [Blautia sp.]
MTQMPARLHQTGQICLDPELLKRYQIQYSRKKNFSSGNIVSTITKNSTTSLTLTGLASGSTYYVRIRTFKKVSGKTYYSAWSAVKSAKIK